MEYTYAFEVIQISLLNNAMWLRQKYEVEGLSTKQIAPLVGATSSNSVRQALIRHDIRVRTIGEGLTHKREDDGFVINHDVIEGCLLGDAGLRSSNKQSKYANAYFYKRNKYYDHICYVAKLLFPQHWSKAVKETVEKYKSSPYTLFSIRSLSYSALNSYYERWYPRGIDRIKVVPEDLVLTPVVLLHWFLDDGSSYWRRKNSPTKQVHVTLSSESFSLYEHLFLKDLLRKTFDIKTSIKSISWGSGCRLEIPQSQSTEFFRIIGDAPVPSLSYKWK